MPAGRHELSGSSAAGRRLSRAAVVLAGGSSVRFGSDKLSADYAGRPLLDVVLAGLPDDWLIVVVGHPRTFARPVRLVREEPPGGGPAAGLIAGLRHLANGTELVAVLPGDAPGGGAAAVRMLDALAARPDIDALVATTPDGREQPLQLALRPWAAAALVVAAGPSGAANARARTLLAAIRERSAPFPLTEVESADIDTPADLAAARVRSETGQAPIS